MSQQEEEKGKDISIDIEENTVENVYFNQLNIFYRECKELFWSIYGHDEKLIIRKDIQILRALSIIIVFIYHLGLHKWFFGAGFIGVDIFFVISGYLVVGTLIKEERNDNFSIIVFISRRIKRLFIPSVFCLCFIFLCSFIFFMGFRLYKDLVAATLHYINYYFVINQDNYFGIVSTESYLLHYWSLAVEEQFYFLLPILFGLYKLTFCFFITKDQLWNKVWLFLTVVSCTSLISVIFLNNDVKFFFVFTRIWEFLVGAIVYEFEGVIKDRLLQYPLSCKIGQISSLLILILLSFILPVESWPNHYTIIVIFISSIFIIIPPSIECIPLEMIGNWSYSIYLYHYPIIKIIQSITNIHSIIKPLLSTVITIILSLFSYYFIEKVHRINKWDPMRWISFYIIISCLLGFVFLYYDTKGQIRDNQIVIIMNNTSFYDPLMLEYNQTLFKKSVADCIYMGSDPLKTFWGPGYVFPDKPYSDLVIEVQGRPEYCIIVLGNSRARHYVPLIKLFVNLTNSTLYDGCTHAKYRYSNISDSCREIITFIGDDIQALNDSNHFSKIGNVIHLVGAPKWFVKYKNYEKDVLECISKNITLCNVPHTDQYINSTFSALKIGRNVSYFDFTDDFCSKDLCYLNVGNQLVTYDTWHFCQGSIVQVWPKFLNFMSSFDKGRIFLR